MAYNRTSEAWPLLNARAGSSSEDREDNPLFLSSGDNPGLLLVTHPLDGSNYLAWKRSMMIALGAKTKLGFINGTVPMPEENDVNYVKWKKVDLTVTSWILNTLSKDVVEGFLYAESAKELWEEIAQRFGESNGPLIFQLQRDISNHKQGNESVMVYFNKLKKMWDEFGSLVPQLVCKCDIGKAIVEQNMQAKLMQFLMGLNDSYEHVKNQILLMDPLPSVNRAYSMVLSAERQRHVHSTAGDLTASTAMTVKYASPGKDFNSRSQLSYSKTGQMMTREEKSRLVCDHCGKTGHEKSTCFKIHGYPEWFKDPRDKRGKGFANAVQTEGNNKTQWHGNKSMNDITLIAQEVAKLLGRLPQGVKLTSFDGHPMDEPDKYRRLIGRLLYLNMTRPDVSYAVQQLSQFVTNPFSEHWEAAISVLRYLKGTTTLGLLLGSQSDTTLQAFCDADWATCKDTRRSITGYCVFLGRSLVSWKSKKQVTVARSSAEAEYRAMGTTVCELQWMYSLAKDLSLTPPLPITLWCDNHAAMHITANPVFHERTKHLEIDCHIVRDKFKAGFILPSYVPSSAQLADFFTKPLPTAMFHKLLGKLGVFDATHTPT